MWKKITTASFEPELRKHVSEEHPEIDAKLPLEELLERHDGDDKIHRRDNEGHESPWDY